MRYSLSPNKYNTLVEIFNWIEKNRINKIYITQTGNTINPLDTAIPLHRQFKGLDILLTISTKYFPTREEIRDIISKAQKENLSKFLIVSGYPQTELDSVTVIRNLNLNIDIYCAYNPYEAEIQNENQRLTEKLKNPNVKGVCLQIGIDPRKLEKGITFIKSQNDNLLIEGCLLEPTPQTLQRLKEKPIHGIYVTEKFLEDTSYAVEQMSKIHEIYQRYNIEEIIENFN